MSTKEEISITQQQVRQQEKVLREMVDLLDSCGEQTHALQTVIREECSKTECSQIYLDNVLKLQSEIKRIKQQVDDCYKTLKQSESDVLGEAQVIEIIERLLDIRYILSDKYLKIASRLIQIIDDALKERCIFYLNKFNHNSISFQLADCDISASLCYSQFELQTRERRSLVEMVRNLFKQEALSLNSILLTMFPAVPLYPALIQSYVQHRETEYTEFFTQFVFCEGIFIQRTEPVRELVSKAIKQPRVSNLLYYELARMLGLHKRFLGCKLDKELEYNLCIDTNINIVEQMAEIYAESKQSYKNVDYKEREKLIASCEGKLSAEIKAEMPIFSYQQEMHFLEFLTAQMLQSFRYEYSCAKQLFDQAIQQVIETGEGNIKDDKAVNAQIQMLSSAVASEIMCPSFIYISQMIEVYAKHADVMPNHQFCYYDLVQTFNVMTLLQNACIFSAEHDNMVEARLSEPELQHIADVEIPQCSENIVSQTYFNLNNSFTNPSNFIAYLLIFAYESIFQAAKQLFDKFDTELFPARENVQNEPVVIEQATIVLNQLEKMISMTKAVKILNPKLKLLDVCSQQTSTAICEIPQYKSSYEAGIIEQRVYYLLYYLINSVEQRDNETVNLLQKINTFSFISDYLGNTTYNIGQLVSDELKAVVQTVIDQLIELYGVYVWERAQKIIRVAELCVALRHAYDKWLAAGCVSQTEYDKVVQELVIYERQRITRYGKDQEAMSVGSKPDSPDADQQSNAESSMYSEVGYENDVGKSYSRLRSKTLLKTITSVICGFNECIEDIFASHNNFNVENKNVKRRMSEKMGLAISKYELFESICCISPVSEKYMEQTNAIPADDLDARCKELLG